MFGIDFDRSGAGKSGGQAAVEVDFNMSLCRIALSARWRRHRRAEARTVVLDEAFERRRLTTMAMRIFEAFGFQMIVATPDVGHDAGTFIGGACFVHIRDAGELRVGFDILPCSFSFC